MDEKLGSRVSFRKAKFSSELLSLSEGGKNLLPSRTSGSAKVLAAVATSEWKTPKELREDPAFNKMPKFILHPCDTRYRNWLYFALAGAIWTVLFTPYCVAFLPPGLYPWNTAVAGIEYTLTLIFCVDMAIRFRVAYNEGDEFVVDPRRIALHYLRTNFPFDFLGLFPVGYIVLTAYTPTAEDSAVSRYLCLLLLLYLLRAYRIQWFSHLMEYNLSVGLFWVTLIRNVALIFTAAHWAACSFSFINVQLTRDGVSSWTSSSTYPVWDPEAGNVTHYIQALYMSITTLATIGYGDWHPVTTADQIFDVFFMSFAVFFNAYILGTITILVVKRDNRLKAYRALADSLKKYTSLNNVPESVVKKMENHLRLHYNNMDLMDSTLLGSYPSTLKRRIKRHKYLEQLRSCYLFEGCRLKFLDALLDAASVQYFMPQVDLIRAGEQPSELTLLVAGVAEFESPEGSNVDNMVLYRPAPGVGTQLGSLRVLVAGQPYGAVSFFTEEKQLVTITTATACRILTLTRPQWNHLKDKYPIGSRTVAENLLKRSQETCRLASGEDEPQLARFSSKIHHASSAHDLAVAQRSVESSRGAGKGADSAEMATLKKLLQVRQLITAHLARVDEARIEKFLCAAATGDTHCLRTMRQQGISADSHDYDERTGLMLAAVKGNCEVIRVLLELGANPNAVDALGNTALLEAARHNHEQALQILQAGGAKLSISSMEAARMLCGCVFKCNLPQLRHFLAAGMDPNAGDYDDRRAIHIGAAEASLTAVKVLVEEGGADLNVQDRWKTTPLDEAIRVGALPVAEYLRGRGAICGRARDRTLAFIYAASRGDTGKVLRLLQHGPLDVNSVDYDNRDALMLAAAGGHLNTLNVLLGAGATCHNTDSHGGNALLEACTKGHDDVLEVLVKHGASLNFSELEAAARLCQCVLEVDKLPLLRRYISAKVNVDAADYDKRSALHVAASEGNLEAIKQLVEVGKANTRAVDRWGTTPAQAAKSAGHTAAAAYLAES